MNFAHTLHMQNVRVDFEVSPFQVENYHFFVCGALLDFGLELCVKFVFFEDDSSFFEGSK